MKNYVLSFFILFIVVDCLAQKRFRKLTKTESASIKKYKKTIPKKDGCYHVLIMTDQGNMVVKLYNETPLHRDNFIRLVNSRFYEDVLFHRVINGFMVQAGDALQNQAAKFRKMIQLIHIPYPQNSTGNSITKKVRLLPPEWVMM